MNLKALLVVVAVAAGNLSTAQDWTCYGRTYTRNTYAPVSFANLTWHSTWSSPQDFGAPIIVGDSVFARRIGGSVDMRTVVARFRASDGAMSWQRTLVGSDTSTLTYWNGLVLVAAFESNNGYLCVLDAATGSVLARSVSAMSHPIALPTSATTVRVYQFVSGRMYWHDVAKNGATATISPVRYRNVPFLFEPVCTGRWFYGSGYDGLVAFDRTNGHLVTLVPWESGVLHVPTVYSALSKTLLVGKSDHGVGTMECFSVLNDGTLALKWESQPIGLTRTPAIDENGDVYTVSGTGVSKFDGSSGLLIASRPHSSIGYPVVTKSHVFLQDHTVVRVLDRTSLVQVGLLTGLYTPLTRLTSTAASARLVVTDHDSGSPDNLGIRAFLFAP